MSTSSLNRLGGLALLLAEVLFTLVNVWYFLSGQTPNDTPRAWLTLLGIAIQTLGLMALYATLAPRSGIVGLVGFILLVCAAFYSTASTALSLAVAEKVMTAEQLSQAAGFHPPDFCRPRRHRVGMAGLGTVEGHRCSRAGTQTYPIEL